MPSTLRDGGGRNRRRYPDVGVARRAVPSPTNKHCVPKFGCLPLDLRFAASYFFFLLIFRFYFLGRDCFGGRPACVFRSGRKPDLEIFFSLFRVSKEFVKSYRSIGVEKLISSKPYK